MPAQSWSLVLEPELSSDDCSTLSLASDDISEEDAVSLDEASALELSALDTASLEPSSVLFSILLSFSKLDLVLTVGVLA